MTGSGPTVFGLFDDAERAARMRDCTPYLFAL